jgi:hypothetical protein
VRQWRGTLTSENRRLVQSKRRKYTDTSNKRRAIGTGVLRSRSSKQTYTLVEDLDILSIFHALVELQTPINILVFASLLYPHISLSVCDEFPSGHSALLPRIYWTLVLMRCLSRCDSLIAMP